MKTDNSARREDGFTLIEILVALGITAVLMTLVAGTLIFTVGAREKVAALTESTEAGSRILNLLERDIQGLWTHNIKDNRVLIGRDMDLASAASDRIDFLTSTDSISTIEKTDDKPGHASVCEVGYWLKSHPKYPDLMELWRREDPMVDDDLLRGGTFQLIHNRISSFSITYYNSLGKNAEEILDWDSSTEDTLPRVIKIEFTIERKLSRSEVSQSAEVDDFESNSKKYTRYIVLEKDFSKILEPSVAMIPVIPSPPSMEPGGQGGNNGPGGPIGPAGPAGPAGGSSGVARVRDGGNRTIRGDGEGSVRNNVDRGNRGQRPGNRGGIPPGFENNRGNVNLNDLFRNLGGNTGGNPFTGGR